MFGGSFSLVCDYFLHLRSVSTVSCEKNRTAAGHQSTSEEGASLLIMFIFPECQENT